MPALLPRVRVVQTLTGGVDQIRPRIPDGVQLCNGRGIHDMYLLQVKTKAESTEPWDYFKVVQKIPGEEAFTKLADSKCPLVKK